MINETTFKPRIQPTNAAQASWTAPSTGSKDQFSPTDLSTEDAMLLEAERKMNSARQQQPNPLGELRSWIDQQMEPARQDMMRRL